MPICVCARVRRGCTSGVEPRANPAGLLGLLGLCPRAQVEIYAQPGSTYNFHFMAKGGGSANKTFLFQQTKALLNDAKVALRSRSVAAHSLRAEPKRGPSLSPCGAEHAHPCAAPRRAFGSVQRLLALLEAT